MCALRLSISRKEASNKAPAGKKTIKEPPKKPCKELFQQKEGITDSLLAKYPPTFFDPKNPMIGDHLILYLRVQGGSCKLPRRKVAAAVATEAVSKARFLEARILGHGV